jgi:teichuronic acid biosynthesis glycosyltransferase TuaC
MNTLAAFGSRPLHLLTLTPFYPSANNDAGGCFVADPIRFLEKFQVKSTVMAAQPFYRGAAPPNPDSPPAIRRRFFSLPGGFGLPTAGSFLFATVLSEVRRIHAHSPIDLIHAHAALPCGHAAALLARELRIPFVVSVHGLDAYFTNQVRGLPGRWCANVAQWVYGSARRVICISEKVRSAVLHGTKSKLNAVVVYNGVDPAEFSPRETGTGAKILSVGNLIPTKGQELLLRAFAEVKDTYPDAVCDLIGDGPERARLASLAGQLELAGRVNFLGRKSRADVARAMQACTIFALPSRYEGLGCVYLEAMSCEKAVVGCREQGIEEVIQNGRNGWLIAPGDLRDMTDALHFLLQDPYTRRRMGQEARSTILEGFTLKRQAEMLASVYRGCVA